MEGGHGGFLPPQPGGPEPDLGERPPQAQPQQPPQQQQRYEPPQPQGWQPPPPGWTPGPREPDNNPAVAGFTTSLIALGLLFISAGISSVLSLIGAGVGIFYSVRGKRRVDRGETPKHRGLAQAGLIIGIIGVAFSLLATAVWIAVLTNDELLDDLERELDRELDQDDSLTTLRPLGLLVARGTGLLLGSG